MDWKELFKELKSRIQVGKEIKIILGILLITIVLGFLLQQKSVPTEPESTTPTTLQNISKVPPVYGELSFSGAGVQAGQKFSKPVTGIINLTFDYPNATLVNAKLISKENTTVFEQNTTSSIEIDTSKRTQIKEYPFIKYDYPDGVYTLRITVYNQTGQMMNHSFPIIIEHADTITPSITVTSTRNNEIISGNTTLRVTAVDNKALKSVKWCRNYDCLYESAWDEMERERDNDFKTVWQTSRYADGAYLLRFRAVDAQGNQATVTLSVEVKNT
ncbi:MAG: hypothetical protein GOU97_00935 [Nanoarchaeota archaeon]|nr:hypothetical protein [Nanoarchaeota archaeon]